MITSRIFIHRAMGLDELPAGKDLKTEDAAGASNDASILIGMLLIMLLVSFLYMFHLLVLGISCVPCYNLLLLS